MNYWDKLMVDDAGAATYMETYGEGPGCDTRLMLSALLKPGEKVLDVGCGPGWNFDHFLEYGPSVVYRGMDYSGRFVRVASERVKPMRIFEVGDVRNILKPNDSFDVVILQDVLEHTNGYEDPVWEALRVAKKRVIIAFWRMSEGTEDTVNDDGDDGFGAAYSRSKWEKFLDSLDVYWFHTQIFDNKTRDFYVLDKELS